MVVEFYILLISFFVIALVYSSVGFGGGSSYLALLAVVGVGYELIRPTALLCNIVVVTGATIIFIREKKLDLRKALPFVLSSIPAAFLGGYWQLGEDVFFVILGVTLLIAAVLLWIKTNPVKVLSVDKPMLNASLGGGIGFLSGLVGIGGGIFLSPVLHLIGWDEARKISALASFFILVNSIGGLAGQLTAAASIDFSFILPLLLAVFLGGQLGSRLGSRYFDSLYIKRTTAVLIMVAAINILKDHL